jgi:hypothetical protein
MDFTPTIHPSTHGLISIPASLHAWLSHPSLIPACRLRAVDIKVMYELGRYVPLVPVITKADTMTIREVRGY